VEYNCSLIKVDWLAACIALRVVGAVCISRFPPAYLPDTPAKGKQGPIPDEISQTLLTKKKQGNLE
jgi:hypothetical protein